jgi:predicted metal-dependent hydrolase
MDYILIRSKRKTLALYITDDARLEARAPLKMPKSDIDRFIEQKQSWISKHLSAKAGQFEKRAAFRLDYGDFVLFRGKEYPIEARGKGKAGFDGKCFYMPGGFDSDRIKETVKQIYKQLAKKLLTAKTAEFAAKMSVSPSAVKISSAKTRWGSCSGSDSISYSWRLVLAGDDVIDYVVLHELSHIKHHDHSESFWAEVSAVMPDHKRQRRKLKVLQAKLEAEGW